MDLDELDRFFQAYLVCALWSSHDNATPEGGEPFDRNYEVDDIPEAVRNRMRDECREFIEANLADLANLDAEACGHDFWLTRNGHGAGFWDRGLGALGRRLTDACDPYGTVDLYVGDDGKVWASGFER